jgi:hypothetical protein
MAKREPTETPADPIAQAFDQAREWLARLLADPQNATPAGQHYDLHVGLETYPDGMKRIIVTARLVDDAPPE